MERTELNYENHRLRIIWSTKLKQEVIMKITANRFTYDTMYKTLHAPDGNIISDVDLQKFLKGKTEIIIAGSGFSDRDPNTPIPTKYLCGTRYDREKTSAEAATSLNDDIIHSQFREIAQSGVQKITFASDDLKLHSNQVFASLTNSKSLFCIEGLNTAPQALVETLLKNGHAYQAAWMPTSGSDDATSDGGDTGSQHSSDAEEVELMGGHDILIAYV